VSSKENVVIKRVRNLIPTQITDVAPRVCVARKACCDSVYDVLLNIVIPSLNTVMVTRKVVVYYFLSL